jgi:hypothetical protein
MVLAAPDPQKWPPATAGNETRGKGTDVNPAPLFTAAACAYGANVALGSGVALGVVDTSSFRWIHHGIYIATCVLGGAAASSAVWSRSNAGLALLPAAVPLAALARLGSRPRRRHALVALSAAPFFLLGLVASKKVGHGVP